MVCRRYLLFAALIGANFICPLSLADTVVVRSGERLGGKVMHKSGDTLTFLTNYAGLIRIQWSKIVSISTDAPVILQLDDGKPPFHATLGEDQPDQIFVMRAEDETGPEEAEQSVRTLSVAYINPLPEETTNGVNYKGRATMSLTKTEGNSDIETVYAEGSLAARARNFRYEVSGKGNWMSAGGRPANSNWLLRANYDRFFDPKFFAYGRVSVERDTFRGIDRRDTVGGGYGRQVVDTPKTQVSLRAGVDFIAIHQLDHGTERYPSLGWGIKLSHRLESYRTEVFHEQEGYWNISDTGQISMRTRTGLRVPLMAGVTATSQVNIDWEHRPLARRKPINSMLLFGLGYEW